ncbi:MAG TPA: hypothetical protein VM674_01560, partial [Candidatus Acidoferrum sp.]|nr:hypothetical protein [Candidatus Acidoferrum sp.]
MDASRGGFAVRIGLTIASALLLLVGASFNSGGRVGLPVALGGLTGMLALGAGVLYRKWRLAVPLAALALVMTLVVAQFNPLQGDLVMQLIGLGLLGLGGVVGALTYRHWGDTLRRERDQVATMNAILQRTHRAFLSATSDGNGAQPADTTATTAKIAQDVDATFALCYLASADGRRFVPQPPGIGVDRLRPQAVTRPHGHAGPLLGAIESGKTFVAPDESA